MYAGGLESEAMFVLVLGTHDFWTEITDIDRAF